MVENSVGITAEKQMNLEIQLIINRRLYERNVIDKTTYEIIMNEILKELQKTKEGTDLHGFVQNKK